MPMRALKPRMVTSVARPARIAIAGRELGVAGGEREVGFDATERQMNARFGIEGPRVPPSMLPDAKSRPQREEHQPQAAAEAEEGTAARVLARFGKQVAGVQRAKAHALVAAFHVEVDELETVREVLLFGLRRREARARAQLDWVAVAGVPGLAGRSGAHGVGWGGSATRVRESGAGVARARSWAEPAGLLARAEGTRQSDRQCDGAREETCA